MPYTPSSIKQKIIQKELAEKEAKAQAQKKQREEQRIKLKEKKIQQMKIAEFYKDLAKDCLEAALDGKSSCFFIENPKTKYQEILEDGNFEVIDHELTNEELFRNHRKIFYQMGFDESSIDDDLIEVDEDDFEDDFQDEDQDTESSNIVFKESELYYLHHKLNAIFEKGYDKINYMTADQSRFFLLISSSRFTRANQDSNVSEILIGLKDLLVLLTEYEKFDFSRTDVKNYFAEPANAIEKLKSHIKIIKDVLDRHRKSEKILKSKIIEKYYMSAPKRGSRKDSYKLFSVEWGNGGGSESSEFQDTFFIAWALEWIADDKSSHGLFESIFSFIELSIEDGYSSCLLEFEEFEEKSRDDDHKEGLFSDGIHVLVNLTKIQRIFECLGYQVEVKKVKRMPHLGNKNLAAKYELSLVW